MSKCKSCGRTIIWAKSPTGKNLCFDPVTVNGTKGYFIRFGTPDNKAEYVSLASGTGDFFISHWATCPSAAQHRPPAKEPAPAPAKKPEPPKPATPPSLFPGVSL